MIYSEYSPIIGLAIPKINKVILFQRTQYSFLSLPLDLSQSLLYILV